ncbi:unnamed protein product [Lymnaea stagnalis]|uniref:VPS9 domain-containing protein n=1 Tax=Lymnaea stagnalis TaxID=6523 RepID=A0AAV2I7H9_LYMST
MACDIDELEVNPFYKALQSQYVDLYERAQECCYLLCIPQSSTISSNAINTDFVETHILRPSPYFKGQFMTTHSSNSKTLGLSDDSRYFRTINGFTVTEEIHILGEELAYNRDYKPYKILILDRPLDSKFKSLLMIVEASSNASQSLLMIVEASFNASQSLLMIVEASSNASQSLLMIIKEFVSHYMVLPDYLDEAAHRLEEISTQAFQVTNLNLLKPIKSNPKMKEMLAGTIESYLMNAVYDKLFPVICQHMSARDKTLLAKCQKVSKVKPEQIGVKREFSCPLPMAVVELANLGSLRTPREKLFCLKSTVDNITKGIAVITDFSNALSSLTPLMLFLSSAKPEACITTDDLIPILVTVIAKAKCCHLNSDLFYTEKFMWTAADRDMDDLGFCLVSFKAAVQYMAEADFTDLKETDESEISLEDLMAATSCAGESISSRNRSSHHVLPDLDVKSRRERQLNRISGLLERTVLDLKSDKKSQTNSQQIQSIFPGQNCLGIAHYITLIPLYQGFSTCGSDFLSALQEDDFDQSFGKQT